MTADVHLHATVTGQVSVPAGLDRESSGLIARGNVPLRDHVIPALHDLCAKLAPDGLGHDTGCFVGASWTSGLAARQIRDTVDERGWRWIDPEAFLYYSPHALAAATCIEHGLTGPALTFVGDTAHEQALGFASLQCRDGVCPSALVIGLDSVPHGDDGGTTVRLVAALLAVTPGPAVLVWGGPGATDPVASPLTGTASWFARDMPTPEHVLSPGAASPWPRAVRRVPEAVR